MPDRAQMLQAVRGSLGRDHGDDSLLFPDLPLWIACENWIQATPATSVEVDGWTLSLLAFDAPAAPPHEVVIRHVGNRFGADANVLAGRSETYAASLVAFPRSWVARLSFALGLHRR